MGNNKDGQPLKLDLLVYVAVVIMLPVVIAQTEIYRTERLRSDICINETKCPPWKNEDLVIDNCRYTVKEGYSYQCTEPRSGTRLEFVTPELQCEAGYVASPEVDEDNSDIIVVYKKPCPPGFYQPKPSGCYDACRFKHNLLDLLKSIKSFKIYSPGNNVHPAQVFCNFEDGYYSADGTDFFYYNNRFVYHYKNFCSHVNVSNPCTDGQFPLHNKTCVSPCRQGYERVVHDDFLCKRSNGSDASQEENYEERITTEKNIENGITKRKNGTVTQAADENEPTLASKPKTSTILRAVIIGVIAVIVIVAILVICLIRRYWNGCQRANSNELSSTVNYSCDYHRGNSGDHPHTVSSNGYHRGNSGDHPHTVTSNGYQGVKTSDPQITVSSNGYQTANSSDRTSTVTSNGISGQPLKKPHDDGLSQSMVDNFSTQMKSVGALITKNGDFLGTVFRVRKDCVMTALHVIDEVIGPYNPGQNVDSKLSGVFLNFNENLINRGTKTYNVDKIVWKHAQFDVVILRIANPDDNLPRPVVLWSGSMSGLELTDVSIVGYGNPNCADKKQLDPKCKLLNVKSERIRSAHAWLQQNNENLKAEFERNGINTEVVDLGYKGYDLEEMFLVDCFAEEGSSGSPAFTNNANSIKVVGMITHGYPQCFHKLKKFSNPEQFPVEYRFETGVRMEYIYISMEPEIRDQFFSSP